MMPRSDQDCVQFFDEQAERWRGLYASSTNLRDRLMLFTGTLKRYRPAPASVLDLGCGPGVIALSLAASGYEVTGVDAAPHMVALAEKERERLGMANVSFQVADARSLVLDEASYDAVVCSSLIEYLEDDMGLLQRLARALRPGGVLLLSAPNAASIIGKLQDVGLRMSWQHRKQRHGWYAYLKRRYDARRLQEQLRELSLDCIQCTFFEMPLLRGRANLVARARRCGVMMLLVARRAGSSAVPESRQEPCTPLPRPAYRRARSRKNVWDAAPKALRALFGNLTSCVPPAVLLGRRFRKSVRFVGKAQWWSTEQARDYQLGALHQICYLAYTRTGYYRRLFDSVGFHPSDLKSLENIAALPMMDKHTVIEHAREMCAMPVTDPSVDYVSTGGSSGVPLYFYIGRDRSAVEYAYLTASWARAGYRLGMPLAVIRGRVVQADSNGLYHEYDPLLRYHYYSNFHMTDENMHRYVEHMRHIGPCFLQAYPSSALILARFLRRSGLQVPRNVKGILAGSETVVPAHRRYVEETFGVRYYSWYGHSEKLVLAAECEHSSDYHVWPTYGYFELVDHEGKPVTQPGRQGEIVGTGFINKVLPFIRYRTGDYATYVADRCEACGRQHVILRDVEGRWPSGALVAGDGSLIAMTAINVHDDTFTNVRQFQFYQDTPGRAVLRVVPAASFSDEDCERIKRSLGPKLDGRVSFVIQRVDAVPLSPRGKTIYVDQKIPNLAVSDLDR